jgi:hypothetical protein
MKMFRTVNLPVTWLSDRPGVMEDALKQKKFLEDSLNDGFSVTHITSSTVNDVMYVYHILEKEGEN